MKIKRKKHPITGEETSFEVTKEWVLENQKLIKEKGLKVEETQVTEEEVLNEVLGETETEQEFKKRKPKKQDGSSNRDEQLLD